MQLTCVIVLCKYIAEYGAEMARPAKTKEKLIELMEDSSVHEWTIDQLHAELSNIGWEVSYSSVFRAIAHLESDGLVNRLATESDKVTFERNSKHHEHLKCEQCGTMIPLDCVLGEKLSASIYASTGFRVNSHIFSASGMCASCDTNGGE